MPLNKELKLNQNHSSINKKKEMFINYESQIFQCINTIQEITQ